MHVSKWNFGKSNFHVFFSSVKSSWFMLKDQVRGETPSWKKAILMYFWSRIIIFALSSSCDYRTSLNEKIDYWFLLILLTLQLQYIYLGIVHILSYHFLVDSPLRNHFYSIVVFDTITCSVIIFKPPPSPSVIKWYVNSPAGSYYMLDTNNIANNIYMNCKFSQKMKLR